MLYFTFFQLFTAYDTVNIAGLHPKCPHHFAWQPTAWMSPALRSSYLSHHNSATM